MLIKALMLPQRLRFNHLCRAVEEDLYMTMNEKEISQYLRRGREVNHLSRDVVDSIIIKLLSDLVALVELAADPATKAQP